MLWLIGGGGGGAGAHCNESLFRDVVTHWCLDICGGSLVFRYMWWLIGV